MQQGQRIGLAIAWLELAVETLPETVGCSAVAMDAQTNVVLSDHVLHWGTGKFNNHV